MIRDLRAKKEIAEKWDTVKKLCAWRRGVSLPGVFYNETPPPTFYNLPLVLAYSVLEEVLNTLESEGVFQCNAWQLGRKMGASKMALRWQDFTQVDRGRDARNALAHDAKLLSRMECLRFVDAIERELKAWNII
jgi:hypothetical protein